MLRKFGVYLLLPFVLVINTYLALLDPDPHHDGVILSSAIAVRDGVLPYKSFFFQYGPFVLWTNSAVIFWHGHELICLRIFYLLLAVLITVLLSLVSQKGSMRRNTILVLAFWLMANPVWSSGVKHYFNYWPWPDLMTTLLLVSIYVLFIKTKSSLRLVPIGSLTALTLYVKTNSGVLTFILILIYLLFFTTKQITKNEIVKFLFGNALIHLMFLGYLLTTKSFTPFVQNTVLFAYNSYGKSFLVYFLILSKMALNPITLISISILVVYSTRRYLLRVSEIWWQTLLAIVVISSFLIKQALSPDYFAASLLPIHIGVLASIILFALLVAKKFLRKGYLQKIQLNDNERLLIFLAILSLLNILYIGDIFHLWLSAPLVLVLATQVASRMKIERLFLTILILSMTWNTATAMQNMFEDRTRIATAPLKGMYAEKSVALHYEYSLNFLSHHNLRTADYICPDALFLLNHGAYAATNYNPLGWGVSDHGLTSKFLVVCSPNPDYISAEIYSNYKLVDRYPSDTTVNWSHWSTAKLYLFQKEK